ncbi:hypothetical protein [Halobaculum sp. P14]|uniref:hypothetical protein n=1 Tax=Halobaculum sp. P14 TaxID=3421638 RepID=UPI003EBB146B
MSDSPVSFGAGVGALGAPLTLAAGAAFGAAGVLAGLAGSAAVAAALTTDG